MTGCNVATKEIDTTEYGLPGKIVIRGLSGLGKAGVTSIYYKYSEGKKLTDELTAQIGALHAEELCAYTLKRCIISYPGQVGGAPVSDADLDTYPDELLTELMNSINDLSAVPLTEARGKGLKKEH